MERTLRVLSMLLLAVSLGSTAKAATPSSGTINTPSDDTLGTKQTITYYGGPMVASTLAGNSLTATPLDICLQAVTPPTGCDIYTLTVNLPADYWNTRAGNLSAKVTWTADVGDPSQNDMDIYLVDENNKVIASGTSSNSDTGKAEEMFTASYIAPRTYRLVVVNWLSTSTIPRYDATLTFNLISPPPAPPTTDNIFQNFTPPIVNGAQAGRDAGEPSIGYNPKTSNVMYQAGLETFRVSFNDDVTPSTSKWQEVGSTITSTTSLDPILYTDPWTGRTFVSQLYAACSLMAFSDDDGASWFQNPIGCGLAAMVDHQTVGGGPFATGMQAVDPIYNYKNSVLYCAQDIASAQCAVSQTGGIIFNPGMPAYTTLDCGGLHGHVKVGPDGTLYLPNKSCLSGQAAVIVSTDNGLTWTVRVVPGSQGNGADPALDIGSNGTVYFSWTDVNGHAYATASTDKGQTWSQPVDIGAPVSVVNSQFTSVVAGDDDRAAIGWLGTQMPGDDQSATFPGAWHLYVAFTYDRGKTWTTYDATPNDPVQRGCIWNGGGSNPCRNLLDFNGITRDKFGRVLVGYADGCIDDPLDANNQCVTNPPADVRDTIRTSLATIARQSGGKGLIAQYDGQIFKAAPGAPILSGLAGNNVARLTWTEPSNNGAAITGYRIYRGTNSGGETLLKAVGTVTSFDDTTAVNGTTYYYQVTAVNALGESVKSNEIALTPQYSAAPSAPQRLHATAKKGGIMLTWGTPSSSGTAKITNYRIYRGILPGMEKLLTTTGNTTKYDDTAVTAGTTYYYVVKAVNAVGESSASNEASAQAK